MVVAPVQVTGEPPVEQRDGLAGVEAQLFRLHGGKNAHRDFRREALFNIIRSRYLPPRAGHCLDVGCGSGWMTLELTKIGWNVTGLDPSPHLIALAKAGIESAGYHADMLVGEARDAPSLGKFDVLICLDVLEHIEDDAGALRALHEALVPGGVAIFSVPALSALYGCRDQTLGHYRRYDKADLIRKIGTTGLQIQDCRFWNLLGVLPYWAFEHLLHSEVYDGLRAGSDSAVKRAIREILARWLTVEGRLTLPLGLSLICVARRVGATPDTVDPCLAS